MNYDKSGNKLKNSFLLVLTHLIILRIQLNHVT